MAPAKEGADDGDVIPDECVTGAGSFTRQFDHMAEVTGRAADHIIASHRDAA